VKVFGGAISPRGIDRPGTGRDTHSPTVFIEDMGAAYRASGLTGPVMDALAIHPYPENSQIPPTLAHPNTTPIGIADYTKLVGMLTQGLRGHGPARSDAADPLRRVRRRDADPRGEGAGIHGHGAGDDQARPESTQASYYRQAMAMSFCQPNVMGLLIFHAFDETALDRFQSGLYYPDETAKSSLPTVRASARDVRGGVIAKCVGLELSPKAKVLYPRVRSVAAGTAAIGVTCDIDCTVYARLERLAAALDHARRPRRRQAGERASPSSARRARAGPLPLHRPADRTGQPR
jgi:hypothetical protein